jgi:hypothetical protein
VDTNGRYQNVALRIWTSKLVRQLNYASNDTSQTIHFWLDNILGGYIIDFAVDYTQSYSVIERYVFKGPQGRLMKSLVTWIKMLLCDKCMMKMEFDF